ncbi:MAG: efflux RND transporter periplasmic adaptor subunit [Spirochaetales bacterium]|nr:efflux RND transporter periplasmic adaptor subunit [Spirochaetales bacterium]
MKNRADFIFKAIVTGAILISLIIMVGGGKPKESDSRSRPSGKSSAPRETPSQAVEASTATIRTVSNYIKVNGDMTARAEISIYPDTSGRIIGLNVSEGDSVRSGQTVAVVDPSLPGQKFAPNSVYVPVGGTVLAINSHVGDKVSPSTALMTVGDLSDLELITYVPEKFAGYVKTGLPAEVTFAAFKDRTYTALIDEVGTVINPASRTLEVTLKLTGENPQVKPGMFAAIKLVTEQAPEAVALPSEALFTYYGKDSVFVITAEGKAERREVVLGLSSPDFVEILSGVEAGETVVTAGQSLLKEGSPVHAVE